MPFQDPETPYEAQRNVTRAKHVKAGWDRAVAQPGVKLLGKGRARIGMVDDWLDPATCLELIHRIDAENERSQSYADQGISDRRTSYSSNFDRNDPLIEDVDNGLAAFFGVPPRQGETIQGQRYDVGQYFRPHPDFFLIDQPHWEQVTQSGGQRTFTAMIYLNNVVSGGATRFIDLDMEVLPKTGRMLFWSNLDEFGAPDPLTFHEGADVAMGRKYIVTKWFRERNWF